jgi:ribosomal protein S18 acetylase RimI-like enzyme
MGKNNPSILDTLMIRPAREPDLLEMEWDGEYQHFRRLYREIFQSTAQGRALMWVGEDPLHGLIGQVFVQLRSGRPELADGRNRAYIYGFRVKPNYRNRGVGSRMLERVEVDLVQRGVVWATLNVGKDNSAARRLYERHSYIVVGEEPGHWYYSDDEGRQHEVLEPAWRMEKNLSRSLRSTMGAEGKTTG